MKERPILFSAPMVRAILESRKTQTRRVCKGQREQSNIHDFRLDSCPYGQPGDQLWVREAIRLVPDQEPDDGSGDVLSIYDADGSLTVADAWPWKRSFLSAMFCPRGLSRITLEITGVRVERVQEITVEDCLAEGIDTAGDDYNEGEKLQSAGSPVSAERYAFASLWNSINAKRGFGWDANPWVWVVDFRKVEA